MIEQNAGTEGTTTASKERSAGGVAAKSHEAAEQLKNAVVDQADQVRHKAESARDQTAERIRRVASQLRDVGDTLRSEDQMASAVAERASRGVEGVANYVATTDLRGIIRDTEQLARRQPALFFGSAFMIGLALGRFLKNAPPDSGSFGSSSRSGEGRNERFGDPRSEASRVNRPAPGQMDRQMDQPRFRENYDAAFGRDIPEGPIEASTTVPRPSVSSAKASGDGRNGDRAPESNGGLRAGRGKSS